jgi:truncated hemoglobin YjbI
MKNFNYPSFTPQSGYMTEVIRRKYIDSAEQSKLLPENAHRMQAVLTLTAADDPQKPIQFWQLYSVLGADRIIKIVQAFYRRVFSEEPWFKSVFERVGSEQHHVATQSSMWIDVMGGGFHYHGAEFRLNFHHTHNAMQLMNDKGAERWVSLMKATLDDPSTDYTDDKRVRPAINTFLTFFMSKYAEDFDFEDHFSFGDTNQRLIKRINFLNMSTEAIEALPEQELADELRLRGIDTAQFADKQAMVSKALSL